MRKLRIFLLGRATRVATLSIVSLVALATLVPLGLKLTAETGGYDWAHLSDVSQTLGIIGALASGVALLGIVVSMIHQRDELRVVRLQALRTQHSEIYGMAVHDTALLECFGGEAWQHHDSKTRKQIMFINLMAGYWLLGFELGHFSESTIRQFAREVLSSPSGQLYAEMSQSQWVYSDTSKALESRFLGILYSEYEVMQRAFHERRSSPGGDASGQPTDRSSNP